jgi:hypothetical protein
VEGSSTGDFERWMKVALGRAHLSLKGLLGGRRGGGERASSLKTLEDMLRKSPDMGISVHRGPFTIKGNLESGGRIIHWGL